MSSNAPPEPLSDQSSEMMPDGPEATTDQLLPPVEPPNARFILQLFIIPAVIVLALVGVWLLIGWLASDDEQNADKIVRALSGSSHAQWQKASELASMLQMDARYPWLKKSSQLARQLAQLLSNHFDAQLDDENAIKMRYFLCRVLGEFHVDDGLDILLKTARDDSQRDVRREAIKALAVLGHTFATTDSSGPFDRKALTGALLELADDPDDLIRSETTFALGVISQWKRSDPDSQSKSDLPVIAKLEQLVDDLHADTRYNAALALARSGNLHATEVLLEMLDLESLSASIRGEKDPHQQAFKRNVILRGALDAADRLHARNPELDLPEIRESIRHFLVVARTEKIAKGGAPIPDSIQEKAEQVLARSAP